MGRGTLNPEIILLLLLNSIFYTPLKNKLAILCSTFLNGNYSSTPSILKYKAFQISGESKFFKFKQIYIINNNIYDIKYVPLDSQLNIFL